MGQKSKGGKVTNESTNLEEAQRNEIKLNLKKYIENFIKMLNQSDFELLYFQKSKLKIFQELSLQYLRKIRMNTV